MRVVGEKRAIDYERTQAFFDRRGRQASGETYLTATMYQSPDLAARRDAAEKRTVLPLLCPGREDRVLDVGCGTGRWALALGPGVSAYLGLDFSEPLLDLARRTAGGSARFQCVPVQELGAAHLDVPPPFSLFLCSGILAYLNDGDVVAVVEAIVGLAAPGARLYLREPLGREQRLTLDRFASEELGSEYSAIYRTRSEYLALLEPALSGAAFHLEHEGSPFPDELQNRRETAQRFLIWRRRP